MVDRWTNRHESTESTEICKCKQNGLTQDRYNLLRFKAWNTRDKAYKPTRGLCKLTLSERQFAWNCLRGWLRRGFWFTSKSEESQQIRLRKSAYKKKYHPRICKVLRRLRNHDSFQILRLHTLIPALFSSKPFHVKKNAMHYESYSTSS